MKNKTKKSKMVRLIGAILEWLVYMFAYTIVFLFVNYVFDSFVVDEAHLVLYSFIAVIIIYILNKTIKPVLFAMTIPLTGLTLGLFYFVIIDFIIFATN